MDSRKEVLQALGHKSLSKTWAKIEIFLGLACVFLGIMMGVTTGEGPKVFPRPETLEPLWFVTGLALFVLGGYLAMAGHRSHLYQSMNQSTALLVHEIRNRDAKQT